MKLIFAVPALAACASATPASQAGGGGRDRSPAPAPEKIATELPSNSTASSPAAGTTSPAHPPASPASLGSPGVAPTTSGNGTPVTENLVPDFSVIAGVPDPTYPGNCFHQLEMHTLLGLTNSWSPATISGIPVTFPTDDSGGFDIYERSSFGEHYVERG